MQKNEILQIISGSSADGTPLTVAEQIAALPPEFIARVFETHARLAEESGKKKALNDIVCHMLASGMTADEIVMILHVKAVVVNEQTKYNQELIAKYAKQLKGRRQRAKKKQDDADKNGGV